MSAELFEVGMKTLKSLVMNDEPLQWYKFALKEEFFKGNEIDVFKTVSQHVEHYHKLPKLATLENLHPQIKPVEVLGEPSTYYRDLLITRYEYDVMRNALQKAQETLAKSKTDTKTALDVFSNTVHTLNATKYNDRLVNLRTQGEQLVKRNYYHPEDCKQHFFYWDYIDAISSGFTSGDVVSFVGRPAKGKTFMILRTALENWRRNQAKPLVVSMEMAKDLVLSRVSSMYAHVNLSQVMKRGLATPSEKKFREGLKGFSLEDKDFYIVDGNLTATVSDIYTLADNLGCDSVYIDGAYMLKHPNTRLDRYTRVAENVELMKKSTTELNIPTVASWQLNREAGKKAKKNSKGVSEKAGLEDIGYSDAIGQISSIVMSLEEAESVETIQRRMINLLKGRNGEVGDFLINWLFHIMDFDQYHASNNKICSL